MTADLDGLRLNPHQHFQPDTAKEALLLQLFDALWLRYRERVPYVRTYERVVAEAGASFENDHIAFRTVASQEPYSGIASLSRIFEALGYVPAGCYCFPDKHLSAVHLQYPRPGVPKLFISELRSWELSRSVQKILRKSLKQGRTGFSDKNLSRLFHADHLQAEDHASLLRKLVRLFHELPWPDVRSADLRAVNEESPYGAWVLLHGNNVNHFTALVNSHQCESLDTIDKTVQALRDAGVPMKASIEGDPGSKLRQTATEAVEMPVRVRDKGKNSQIDWTYAYFEIAERGSVVDPETHQSVRFEGFLGPQATHLFEMTTRK
jgi:hypothetical protein